MLLILKTTFVSDEIIAWVFVKNVRYISDGRYITNGVAVNDLFMDIEQHLMALGGSVKARVRSSNRAFDDFRRMPFWDVQTA